MKMKQISHCPKCNRPTIPTGNGDYVICPLLVNGPDTHPDICQHRWESNGTIDTGNPHYWGGMVIGQGKCFQCGSTRELIKEAEYKINKNLHP